MTTIKAAIVQTGSILFDTDATVARLEHHVREAGGADLIVFPEAFIGGYPKGHDFGARIGLRTKAGRDWFRRYFDSAIEVPGLETERIAAAAQAANAWIVTGAVERRGATLYCVVLVFSPDGALVLRRRKLIPTAMERLIWGMGDAGDLGVAETPFGNLAAAICWENYMPLLRSAFYAQLPVIWCAPTVDDRESWLPLMRTIAMEGRCFVLSANQYFTQGDAPEDYGASLDGGHGAALINGGSCVVGPLGDVRVEPVFGREAVIEVELDLDDASRGKFDFDVAGHYARDDIFKLFIDER